MKLLQLPRLPYWIGCSILVNSCGCCTVALQFSQKSKSGHTLHLYLIPLILWVLQPSHVTLQCTGLLSFGTLLGFVFAFGCWGWGFLPKKGQCLWIGCSILVNSWTGCWKPTLHFSQKSKSWQTLHLYLMPTIGRIPQPSQVIPLCTGFPSWLFSFEQWRLPCPPWCPPWCPPKRPWNELAFLIFMKTWSCSAVASHFSQKSKLGQTVHLYLIPLIGNTPQLSHVTVWWTTSDETASFLTTFSYFLTSFSTSLSFIFLKLLSNFFSSFFLKTSTESLSFFTAF